MVNSPLPEETAAHGFFKKAVIKKTRSGRDSAFKEELRQKVLDRYINITTKNMSPTQTFLKRFMLLGGAVIVAATIFVVGSLFISEKIINKNLGLEIAFAEGTVEYQRDGKWTTANLDTKLQQGDVIRVAQNSKAIVNLDDGSAIRLNSDSEIILTSLDPRNIVVTNTRGEIYARVSKSETREFIVSANGVSYKAMGTAYRVTENSSKKGVEVFANKVNVIDQGKEIVVDEGKKYYLVDTKAPTTEKIVQPIVKEEDLKNDTFVDWNKTVDESSKEYKEDLGIFADTTAPELTVTEPQNNSKTTNWTAKISGKTEKEAYVWINGVKVENNEGQFSKEFDLKLGTNNFVVKALDKAGNMAKVELTVTRESPPPPVTPAPTKPPTNACTGFKLCIKSTGATSVAWTVSNLDTPNGFKVVWSKNSGPTYPTRSGDKYHYDSNESARNFSGLSAFKGEGYYYVRVCRYTGGGCDNYSNQIKVYLK